MPSTSSPEPPAWLNLDAVVSPEQRGQVPELALAARALVESVTAFVERALPAWRELDETIARNRGTDVLDYWWTFINELIGLDEVDELVGLAQWALTMVTEGTDSDERAKTVMSKWLTEADAERLREALAKRDEANADG